jgi:murein DD-endopeptidase MepM/ murein hydrolase activator NlpD
VHPVKEANKTRVSMDFGQRYYSDNPAEAEIFRKAGLWGKPHLGVDTCPLPEFKGQEFVIVAPISGEVIRSGFAPDYGFHLRIVDSEGRLHILAHLKTAPIVKVGSQVDEGQDIGWMGSTGNSSGRHLHYEVRNTAVLPPPPKCRIDPNQFMFEAE